MYTDEYSTQYQLVNFQLQLQRSHNKHTEHHCVKKMKINENADILSYIRTDQNSFVGKMILHCNSISLFELILSHTGAACKLNQ